MQAVNLNGSISLEPVQRGILLPHLGGLYLVRTQTSHMAIPSYTDIVELLKKGATLEAQSKKPGQRGIVSNIRE